MHGSGKYWLTWARAGSTDSARASSTSRPTEIFLIDFSPIDGSCAPIYVLCVLDAAPSPSRPCDRALRANRPRSRMRRDTAAYRRAVLALPIRLAWLPRLTLARPLPAMRLAFAAFDLALRFALGETAFIFHVRVLCHVAYSSVPQCCLRPATNLRTRASHLPNRSARASAHRTTSGERCDCRNETCGHSLYVHVRSSSVPPLRAFVLAARLAGKVSQLFFCHSGLSRFALLFATKLGSKEAALAI